jgi:cytochrome d ubiquinol oxidase subunit II
VGPNPGILDWYTTLTGLLALVALSVHGAHYVAMKTDGPVNSRSRRAAALGWLALVGLTLASLIATVSVRPGVLNNFRLHSWGWIIPIVVAISLVSMRVFVSRGRDRAAFLSSTAYLAAMLGGAAFASYPILLLATTDASYSLTIYNARTGDYSLRVGLIWWLAGILLAVGYFTFVYMAFRGKVSMRRSGVT